MHKAVIAKLRQGLDDEIGPLVVWDKVQFASYEGSDIDSRQVQLRADRWLQRKFGKAQAAKLVRTARQYANRPRR